MGVTPQGISIQTAYRWYRDGRLIVNRQYQRKLVWTVAEKQRLIDSIIKGYPLPLFLLAEKVKINGESKYEIIDGMQRLNAIFCFIENSFLIENMCFDVKEFSRARQLAESNVFKLYPEAVNRLDSSTCANILDYQLAVTIFPGEHESRIKEVFGRINSSGRQLSDQERRQAGVLSPFAHVVRELAAEIRGDVSRDELLLSEMPEISIETTKNPHGYSLKAEEIFWCYQGILRTNNLRDSEDEQMIADIVASVLFESPVEASGDYLNRLYTDGCEEYNRVNQLLNSYSKERLADEIKKVFSVIREFVETSSGDRFHFRDTVYPRPTSNPQKQAFYAVFMACYDLIMRQGQIPTSPEKIMPALNNMTERIKVGQKHIKTDDRQDNVRVIKGLIVDFFAKGDVAHLGPGPGFVFDFENSIRRSRTETSRYEFKQGLLKLDKNRSRDKELMTSIVNTICAIANVGPDADGFIHIGIADKSADAERINELDAISAVNFEYIKIVGVDRECKILQLKLDKYMNIIREGIEQSRMTEPLKTQVCSNIDVVQYKGLSVVRIRIPKQSGINFIGDDCFIRTGSATIKASGPQISSITKLFKER